MGFKNEIEKNKHKTSVININILFRALSPSFQAIEA